MTFGQRLAKIREDTEVSQQELARRLGYRTNSYISDMEQGKFAPSLKKLRRIARALAIPFSKIKDSLLESRLEEMGIMDPDFISMIKDYPRFSKEDRKVIIEAYYSLKLRSLD